MFVLFTIKDKGESMGSLNVLIIEEAPEIREALEAAIPYLAKQLGHEAHLQSEQDPDVSIHERRFHLIFFDLDTDATSNYAGLLSMKEQQPRAALVGMTSGTMDPITALVGLQHCCMPLMKPFGIDSLTFLLTLAIKKKEAWEDLL